MTAFEVFLGNDIDVKSERQFLARLGRDMQERGRACRVLANLQAGSFARQVDFVVVTTHRTVLVELKTFPGPVIAAPNNGPWTASIGSTKVQGFGNPSRQAQDATFAFSDELDKFAREHGASGPSGAKFYEDIDAVVCAWPRLGPGSCTAQSPFVRLVGYAGLLEMLLQETGRRVAWSSREWDAFGQFLNLYRDADARTDASGRGGGAHEVAEYRARFEAAYAPAQPVVETAVALDGARVPRPRLTDELAHGQAVLLHGPSGHGKTLWARAAAAELARRGDVPVWLTPMMVSASFRTTLARAISPYTSLSPEQLLHGARAAGRTIAVFLDDLTNMAAEARGGVLDGVRAMRLRNPAVSVLITAQDTSDVVPEALSIELLAPSESERLAVLDAYGRGDVIDRCDAFISPFELVVAAECADALPAGASAAELLDRHIDHLTGGDARIRGALRNVASAMHAAVNPGLPRPELARWLLRERKLDDRELQGLWDCPLLVIAHGRVSFRHERFEQFLAAEAVLVDEVDIAKLSETLNGPRLGRLRFDVLALESDEQRLSKLLAACEHEDALCAAATGRLGRRAAGLAEEVLAVGLDEACCRTTADKSEFQAAPDSIAGGRWLLAERGDRASMARLMAVGRLLVDGRFVDGSIRLLDTTDALCAQLESEASSPKQRMGDQLFAATYVLAVGDGPPAGVLSRAATEAAMFRRSEAPHTAAVVQKLLCGREDQQLGRLWLAAAMLRRSVTAPETADVAVACLRTGRYHLTLIGLQLAELVSAHLQDEAARRRLSEAVSAVPTDNLMLNSAIIEAQAALGELEPVKDVADVTAEIAAVLASEDYEIASQMAYGIVGKQFETEIIGPYYEVVSGLAPDQRRRLLAMALDGSEGDGFWVGWIIDEFEDLEDVAVRAAVERFIAGTDPTAWFNPQGALEAVIGALRLLAQADRPLPGPANEGAADPAWRACLAVIAAACAGGEAPQRLAASWPALLRDHSSVVASLLHALGSVIGMHVDDTAQIPAQVLASMPADGVDVLIWGLENPDLVQPLVGFDRDSRPYVVGTLGRIGDPRAADALRRFVDDPALGEAAELAVRAIENRESLR
jgi:hypothetical protein